MKELDNEKIFGLYNDGVSARKISTLMGVDVGTITNRLRKNGIEIKQYRKYNINYDIFDMIDTEEKAYWLGFITADGYNSGKYIRLDIQDEGHLEKLRDMIYPNKDMPIRTKVNKASGKTIYYLTIQHPKIVSDMIKFGIVKKKSHVTKYPKIKDIFNRHFIRGVFDGDGCLSSSKQTKNYLKYTFSIVGSESLILSIKEIIEQQNIKVGYGSCRSIKRLYICGNQQIGRLLNWIYSDSSVFLDRKFIKYKELINYNKNKQKLDVISLLR